MSRYLSDICNKCLSDEQVAQSITEIRNVSTYIWYTGTVTTYIHIYCMYMYKECGQTFESSFNALASNRDQNTTFLLQIRIGDGETNKGLVQIFKIFLKYIIFFKCFIYNPCWGWERRKTNKGD